MKLKIIFVYVLLMCLGLGVNKTSAVTGEIAPSIGGMPVQSNMATVQNSAKLAACDAGCNRLTCRNQNIYQWCVANCDRARITNCMSAFSSAMQPQAMPFGQQAAPSIPGMLPAQPNAGGANNGFLNQAKCKAGCNRVTCQNQSIGAWCVANCAPQDIPNCAAAYNQSMQPSGVPSNTATVSTAMSRAACDAGCNRLTCKSNPILERCMKGCAPDSIRNCMASNPMGVQQVRAKMAMEQQQMQFSQQQQMPMAIPQVPAIPQMPLQMPVQ